MNPISTIQRAWWLALRKVRGTRYRNLFKEIDDLRPIKIMEIGTWNGENALKMIVAASKHHPVEDIQYYGFDLFEEMTEDVYLEEISKRPPSLDEMTKKLETTGASIKLFKGNTLTSLPEVLPQLPSMDLIFIDGGHSVATIRSDWNQILKVMDKSTVVIFDDYWVNRPGEGCKPVVDEIDKKDFDVTVFSGVDTYRNSDFGKLAITFARVQKRSS